MCRNKSYEKDIPQISCRRNSFTNSHYRKSNDEISFSSHIATRYGIQRRKESIKIQDMVLCRFSVFPESSSASFTALPKYSSLRFPFYDIIVADSAVCDQRIALQFFSAPPGLTASEIRFYLSQTQQLASQNQS